MNFTPEELKYLHQVMLCTNSYIIAKCRESLAPSVNHYKLLDKIKSMQDRMHL